MHFMVSAGSMAVIYWLVCSRDSEQKCYIILDKGRNNQEENISKYLQKVIFNFKAKESSKMHSFLSLIWYIKTLHSQSKILEMCDFLLFFT